MDTKKLKQRIIRLFDHLHGFSLLAVIILSACGSASNGPSAAVDSNIFDDKETYAYTDGSGIVHKVVLNTYSWDSFFWRPVETSLVIAIETPAPSTYYAEITPTSNSEADVEVMYHIDADAVVDYWTNPHCHMTKNSAVLVLACPDVGTETFFRVQ